MDQNKLVLILSGSLAFFSLIFLSGCVNLIGGSDNYFSDYINNLNRIPAGSPEQECIVGNCTCMVCEKGPGLFSYFPKSLAGGRCSFDAECNTTKWNDYKNASTDLGEEYAWQQFMIGQGPSFADFTAANGWCNIRLTMAVHWLTANEYRPYDLPDAKGAVACLDKGVMPVYVLYSGGKNINISRTEEIAHILGKEGAKIMSQGEFEGAAGPVIIVTELEYNGSDADAVQNVTEQIMAINRECNIFDDPNNPEIYCMVAVAPKLGDKEALDAVISEMNSRYGEGAHKKYIHLVAYGLNSHYINASTSYDCNGNRLIEEGRKFSSYALYTYGLPSVIPYILIDVGAGDANNPPKCKWDSAGAINTYNSLFLSGISTLSKVGVIGMALYSTDASSWNNPLGCSDCGVLKDDEKHAMLKSAWYGNCQKYVSLPAKNGTNEFPVRYSNAAGGVCDIGEFSADTVFSQYMPTYTGQYMDLLNPTTPALQENTTSAISCGSCLSEAEDITTVYPILEDYVPPHLPDYTCTAYREFEYYGARFNLDPMLMRASAIKESSFDSCAVAILCKGGVVKVEVTQDIPTEYAGDTGEIYHGDTLEEPTGELNTRNCMQGTGYVKGYWEMYDPRYEAGDTTACYFGNSEATPPAYTFRGMGLMQVLVPPYTYWPAEYQEDGVDGVHVDVWDSVIDKSGAGRDPTGVKIYCSEQYNPFNSSHSICAGAVMLQAHMEDAKRWVENANDDCTNNEGHTIDLFGINENQPKKDVLVGFVALYIYSGVWLDSSDSPDFCPGDSPATCWKEAYCHAKTLDCTPLEGEEGGCPTGCESDGVGGCEPRDDYCYDKTGDFLEFIECRIHKEYDDRDGIFKKMGYYAYLNNNCPNSYCPSWRKIEQGGGKVDFDRNNPYEAESYLNWTAAHTGS